MSNFQVISDHSKEKLYDVPEKILTLSGLKMLFLEGNFIRELPEDFFDKLPRLTWLDLRNNRLTEFPSTVAHHGYLECLFLTNNKLERLPNELGLVPNLKSLQVANNPLIYPTKDILGRGTKGVKEFLMRQHYLKKDEPQEELLLKVVDEEPRKVDQKKSKSSTNLKTTLEDALSYTQITEPELTVTRLSKPHKATQNSVKTEEENHIVHKIRTSPSKMSVLSYYDRIDTKKFQKIVNQKKLRNEWLDKLRVLLANQEKIIQQEKNLSTLSIWRHENQSNSSKSSPKVGAILSAPFATDERYAKIPTRQELADQLDSYLTEKTSITCLVPKNNNLDSLIGDVIKQIRHLEEKCSDNLSPRAEIEEAEKRIRMFLDIHKKLQWLQATNNANL